MARRGREVRNPSEIRSRLIASGRNLSPTLESSILALGPAAMETLLELATSGELDGIDSPGGGYVPIHAVQILGRMHALGAVPDLLELLEELDPLDGLYNAVIGAFEDFGPEAAEPILAALESAGDPDYRAALLEALSNSGARDPRVFAAFVAYLDSASQEDEDERDRIYTLGSGHLQRYGDPAALPALSRALDEAGVDADDDSLMSNQYIIELVDAIEQLGGTLTPVQQRKYAEVMNQRKAWRSRTFGTERPDAELLKRQLLRGQVGGRPGRNDPCWCGSGSKYKKCHERSDEEERFR